MNERTKTIVNWILALVVTGIVLLTLFPQVSGALNSNLQELGYMLTNPSMKLLSYTTLAAISQFGGDMGMEGFNSALLTALTGVTVILILAPTFMVFGYKKSENSEKKLHPATWHLGTGIVIAAIVIGFYSSISFSTHKSELIAATEQQHASDQLQFELIDLYFDAATQAILPHEKGGGNGSFTNFVAEDGSTRNIQLSDLPRYNPDSEFRFAISDNITDSTITMTGITDMEGNNPDFENADGSTGKVQMSLTVNLNENRPRRFEKENERLMAIN